MINPENKPGPTGDDIAEAIMEYRQGLESLTIGYENTEGELNTCVFKLVIDTGDLSEEKPKISKLKFDLDIPNTPEITLMGTLDFGVGEIFRGYDRLARRNAGYRLNQLVDMHTGDVKPNIINNEHFFPDKIYYKSPLLLVARDYRIPGYSEDVVWPISIHIDNRTRRQGA